VQASELMQDAGPFYRRQVERCSELGIDAGALPVSHLAVRTHTWREYLVLRDEFEERSVANLENVWNGRPNSKLLLADPLQLSESASVELVELIPPFHQRVYRMGLEHVGFVVAPTSMTSRGVIAPCSRGRNSRARRSSRCTSCSTTTPT
jgi:predicted metalloenzyme YecM